MLQLSDYVKQDYICFSLQDNANHKYSDGRVYFEKSFSNIVQKDPNCFL